MNDHDPELAGFDPALVTAGSRAQALIGSYQHTAAPGEPDFLNLTVAAVLAEVADDPNPRAMAYLVNALAVAAAEARRERDELGGTP
ncbi:hypothetical protein [Kocuria sp. KH4]